MKSKVTPIILSTFFLSFAVFSFASADTDTLKVNTEVKTQIGNTQEREQAEIELKDEDRGNSTSTEARDTERGNATSTEAKDDNEDNSTSENHRSAVASFVQSLLKVADREGGIGRQVREIAKSQNDSASTTVKAIREVEDRGTLRTFLFGSDYRNLGAVRSELSRTSSNIEKLKTLLNQTTIAADRVEINAQITALEAEQVKVDAFVKEHEDTFSLFGWFNKLFVK
ncbi:MAG: hypothetical protein WAV25_03215 [Minisyncoccia bacterium]